MDAFAAAMRFRMEGYRRSIPPSVVPEGTSGPWRVERFRLEGDAVGSSP